jgi:hypothetical protein
MRDPLPRGRYFAEADTSSGQLRLICAACGDEGDDASVVTLYGYVNALDRINDDARAHEAVQHASKDDSNA